MDDGYGQKLARTYQSAFDDRFEVHCQQFGEDAEGRYVAGHHAEVDAVLAVAGEVLRDLASEATPSILSDSLVDQILRSFRQRIERFAEVNGIPIEKERE